MVWCCVATSSARIRLRYVLRCVHARAVCSRGDGVLLLRAAQVSQACSTIGEMCNLLAMNYLQQGLWLHDPWLCSHQPPTHARLTATAEKFPLVLELLRKARVLTNKDEKRKAVTYNNFACYYRRCRACCWPRVVRSLTHE